MFHFPPQREESTPSGSLEEADRKREGGQAIEYSTRTAYVRAEKNRKHTWLQEHQGACCTAGQRLTTARDSQEQQQAGSRAGKVNLFSQCALFTWVSGMHSWLLHIHAIDQKGILLQLGNTLGRGVRQPNTEVIRVVKCDWHPSLWLWAIPQAREIYVII